MANVSTSPKVLKEAEKSPGAHKKYDVKRETEIDVYGDEDDETTAQPNAESIQAGGNIMGAFDTIKEAAEKVGHAVKRGFESVDKKAHKANVTLERQISGESAHSRRTNKS